MNAIKTVLGKEIEVTVNTYFVVMTDKYLSGWGGAENRIAKRIIICDNFKQAQMIKNGIENCKDQNGMRYINICDKVPYYNSKRYKLSFDYWEDCALYIEKSDIKL